MKTGSIHMVRPTPDGPTTPVVGRIERSDGTNEDTALGVLIAVEGGAIYFQDGAGFGYNSSQLSAIANGIKKFETTKMDYVVEDDVKVGR